MLLIYQESQENIILQPSSTLSYDNNEAKFVLTSDNSFFVRSQLTSHRKTSDNHPHIDPHDVLSSTHEEKLTTRQVRIWNLDFYMYKRY